MSPGYPSYIIDELTRPRAFAPVRLWLPTPPSVNNLFANSANGRRKTEKYKAWRTEAGWMLQTQKPGIVLGPYCLLIEAAKPDHKRRVDLANYEKAISDLLVTHHVIQDDSMAQEIILRWADVESVRVTVTAFQALGVEVREK